MQQTLELLLKLFSISLFRYFTIAGVPFLICYVLMPGYFAKSKIQVRNAKKQDSIREILHSIQMSAVLLTLAYFMLFTPIRQYTVFYTTLSMRDTWYVPLSVFIALIIHDTYFYWTHRLMHHPKLFKHSHLLHHKSTNPSPWTSYSFHITEAWVEGFIIVIVLLVVPMNPAGFTLFTITTFSINVYGHLGYEIAPQWFRNTFLFKIFNTSVHHNMHHSKFKGNYGLYFRIWDRLLGTEHPDYVKEYDFIQQNRFKKANKLEHLKRDEEFAS